ncbi:MAG: DUF4358 domain-containing protein [Lachnospiraceae bacterium]|nr:DUF4358 domain-containing protein [Lachnospiraceae bacterium]MDE6699256.1 DUF4358 domain-containing protein [Lachnospiraceae bacterium]
MRKSIIGIVAIVTSIALSGCGSTNSDNEQTKKNIDINEIQSEVAKAYGDDYIPSYEFDEEYIKDVFGLSKDLYDEIIAEGPKVSFNIDTFIAVKAKEGKGEEVYKILSDYRESQINDAMQYPTNAIKIQASDVSVYGDYVFFTCLGVISEESQNEGDEAILDEAKQDNKIAVDIIKGFFE